jgi:hypothetical protein
MFKFDLASPAPRRRVRNARRRELLDRVAILQSRLEIQKGILSFLAPKSVRHNAATVAIADIESEIQRLREQIDGLSFRNG